MFDFLKHPWPWYVAGPLIGLMVPALLILGNRSFGISSNLRHICAACLPARIPFFKYEWKREAWNLFFAFGILAGAAIAATLLADLQPVQVHPKLAEELSRYGITDQDGLLPAQVISWSSLFTLKGLIMIVFGGFIIGFGTRYAGGCTSGHSIMGLSALQWPSLVATCCFMAGGIVMANYLLPYILKW